MATTYETIIDEQIEMLAIAHVRHFRNLLRSGSPNVRASECEHLFIVWESVKTKCVNYKLTDVKKYLTEEEADEIRDAIECGDYDDLLMAYADAPR